MILIKKPAHLLQVAAMSFALAATAYGQQKAEPSQKRAITAADGIGMTRLEEPDYYSSNPSDIAHFSPDRKRFVVVLRKANIEQDTNEFSMLLYQTDGIFHSPKPDVLVTMSSSSNRDAIGKVRWLADNKTVIFLGESPGQVSQIYAIDTSSRSLKKLTSHPTAITYYEITADGLQLAYVAAPPEKLSLQTDPGSSKEIVITGQNLGLGELLSGNRYQSAQIFSMAVGGSAREAPLGSEYFVYSGGPLSLSPNGRYVVFSAPIRTLPAEWAGYADPDIQYFLSGYLRRKGPPPPFQEHIVWDTKEMSLAPLVKAPRRPGQLYWAPDGNSVFLTSYLPLDTPDPAERKAREQNKFPIEVKLPGREYRKVRTEDIPINQIQKPPVDVALDQDLNTPPKIYVNDPKTKQRDLLLDLNPKFSELDFGAVKTIEWKVEGVDLIAGLYLPPDYLPGKRYPLVIQTHGFEPKEFSMDGLHEWSSAYAARTLAAKGVLVVQFSQYKDHAQIDRVQNDKSLGATVGESSLHFFVPAFELLIDQLDREGLIDRSRIGFSGFSRWACFGGYILTHLKYRFAAASLIDGISCGYVERIAIPRAGDDEDNLMGGAPPFGEGLKLWMKNSPGFNLDKVQTPVQLATFGKGSVLQLWEWYVGLSALNRPVDFVYVPDAIHIGVKPSERLSAEQRVLDWFSFWLLGIENPDPDKRAQYVRWRELRKEYQATSAPQYKQTVDPR